MSTHHQLAGRAALALLLAGLVAGCGRFGPDLSVGVDNTAGPRTVTVTVESSASSRPADPVTIAPGTGAAWSVALGSAWEIRVDGQHLIGSRDRPDLALQSPGRLQDVTIEIRVAGDGTVGVLEAR